MSHSFVRCYIHYVFSTKYRESSIDHTFRDRLWAYMGGVARQYGIIALAAGGVSDHAHLLVALPPTITIAKGIQLIKGSSSHWIHQTFETKHSTFAWQEGYGAFSIGVSRLRATIDYINRQEEHHRNVTFEDEYCALLVEFGVPFDQRNVWG